MKQLPVLSSQRMATTLLINRAISGAILRWGGLASPWVVLAVDPAVFGCCHIVIMSVYLPCVTSDSTLSEERWQ